MDLQAFWELIRPDIAALAAAVTAAVGAAAVNVQLSRTLGHLVNAVTDAAGTGVVSQLHSSAGAVLGLATLQAGCTFCYIGLLGVAGERICERMRVSLFQAMLQQDIEFFDRRRGGELMDRLGSDVDTFRSAFKQCISLGLRNFTQAAGSAIAMFAVSRELATGVAVIVPVAVGFGTLLGSALRRISSDAKQATATAHGVAGEVLGNVRTVKSFAAEKFEETRFRNLATECNRLGSRLALGIGALAGLTHLFTNGMVLSVLYCGGQLMAADRMSPGDLMSFLVSAQTIQRSIMGMSVLFGTAIRGVDAGARVFDYIKMKPNFTRTDAAAVRPTAVVGHIELQQVSFSYPTRPEQEVLCNLSLSIPAGKVIALCGGSGAGKSTVASLIERFYDPSSGNVFLDGRNIRNLDTAWLREQIGFINQEPVLFAGTVADNIRYGRQNATMEEVKNAAEKANADTFIRNFPEQYDTIVGERGTTVSGGQKQRIAIARALLKDPRILVLDEATSALDAESEKYVQEALATLTVGRTVVVIAHRLSTIQNADEIVVLDAGQVAERGTHAELIAQGGKYYQLVQQQVMSDE